jgi:hypothetical protein
MGQVMLSPALTRCVRNLVTTGLWKYPQPADILRVQQDWLLERGDAQMSRRPDGQYLTPTDKSRSVSSSGRMIA